MPKHLPRERVRWLRFAPKLRAAAVVRWLRFAPAHHAAAGVQWVRFARPQRAAQLKAGPDISERTGVGGFVLRARARAVASFCAARSCHPERSGSDVRDLGIQ